MRTDDEIKEWLAIREREALKDADTAEVTWSYCYFPDPYDVDEDLQEDPAAGRWLDLHAGSRTQPWNYSAALVPVIRNS